MVGQAAVVSVEMTRGDRQDIAQAFYGQQLRRVSFAGQDLTSVSIPGLLWLERCSLDGADLRQATLDGMHLKLCTLKNANLRGASLRGVTFAGCDLTGADLRDADLYGASFGAVNTGNSSGRTVLSGALLDQAALAETEVDASTVLPEDGRDFVGRCVSDVLRAAGWP
jgi:uncharacterized protein YjbI with pentapeptide repeats